MIWLNWFSEQICDDVGRPVGGTTIGEKIREEGKVLADRRKGRLHRSTTVALAEPDRRDQSVANTPAPDGVFLFATLAHVSSCRLSRAPVADLTVWGPERDAQVAGLADSTPLLVDLRLGDGSGQVRDLEREPCR